MLRKSFLRQTHVMTAIAPAAQELDAKLAALAEKVTA
jgi:hypothetical protein